MVGRRLIGTTTNRERYELQSNRTDLNLIIFCMKKAVEKGGLKYEDVAEYVALVDELVSIRDGKIIDELEEEQ